MDVERGTRFAREQSDGSSGAEPLPVQRDRFDLPPDLTYLNCAFVSPQLHAVTEAGVDAVRRPPWRIPPREWFEEPEALREAAGRLMGADADGIALVPAASYGVAVAAANIRLERGQNVVLLAEQFPSNVYAWRVLARDRDAAVRVARKPAGEAWTDAVLETINADSGVVAVPNCHWTDGALVDLVAVGRRAREVGAALVVDASQSWGARPLDVGEIRPDFLVSVGYKWQLGPYGLAYLYVAPEHRETGRPIEHSWLTRAGAEDFAGLVDYADAYRPGARRFDMGEYPQFALVPMALAGLRQLAEWGVERVERRLTGLTTRIAEEARALGCEVLEADRRVGHMVGLRFPEGVPDGLPPRLEEARIHVSVRGDSIRVSPHVYNDAEDAGRLLMVLRDFL